MMQADGLTLRRSSSVAPMLRIQAARVPLVTATALSGLSAGCLSGVAIDLTAAERRELESLARAHRTGQAMARRARIVLAAAAGLENKAICTEVGADANTVSKWRRRFAAARLDGLLD